MKSERSAFVNGGEELSEESIYGEYRDNLEKILENIVGRIRDYTDETYEQTGTKLHEHLIARVKSDESMREKCRRRGLPETPYSALHELTDSIGIRIICSFIDDVYENVRRIKAFPNLSVVLEKDYIRHAKPNGYRSYHMIIKVEAPFEDVSGNTPGEYFVELQLRTIAMDSWASLEHKMKYKKNIPNSDIIVAELKRCADELAACDVSMQTIRDLINYSS